MTREEDLDPQIRNFLEEILNRIGQIEGELQDLDSRTLKLEKTEGASTPRTYQSS